MKEVPTSVTLKNRFSFPKNIFCPLKESEVKFKDIHQRFSQSSEGQKLNNAVRWERYKTNDTSNHQWQELMGFDVNNLEHGLLTYKIGRVLIAYQNNSDLPESQKFNFEEQQKLLLACIVHDWGEAKLKDVTHDKKNDTRKEIEMKVLFKITAKNLGKSNKELLKEVVDINKNQNTKLGRAMEKIEQLGYTKTGIRSWKRSEGKNAAHYPDLPLRLKWLSSNVLGNNLPSLIASEKDYPFISHYLDQISESINDAFDQMPNSVFDFYKIQDQQKSISKFEKSKTEWFNRHP